MNSFLPKKLGTGVALQRCVRLVILSLIVAVVAFCWMRRPIDRPPGILVSREPTQALIEDASPAVQRAGFSLRPLAGYVIEGRVLHTHHYLTDGVAKLAPYDVGLAWGRMSDTAILRQLEISQSNRFLFWEYQHQPPLPVSEIETHASNNHLIAADRSIAFQIAWLREGEIIRLEGALVEATAPDGRKWTSSLSRSDTGNGACEIMWVSRLTKL